MGYNLKKLKEISEPRSKDAIHKSEIRYLNKLLYQPKCSAELMDQISFIKQ